MSLILCDGFDHYTDLTRKWTAFTGVASVTTAVKRTGTHALAIQNGGNNGMVSKTFVALEHATIVVGFALYRPTTGVNFAVQFLSDLAVTEHVSVPLADTGLFTVRRGNSSGTVLGVTSIAVPAVTWTYVEIKATLHDLAGAVEVRVNGAVALTLSSIDTKNAGTKTVFDALKLVAVSAGSANTYVDDVYLLSGAGSRLNDFLGDVAVRALYPSGAGSSTGLTSSSGANYTAVDDPLLSTTDYVFGATVDTQDTYAIGDLTGTGTVHAVALDLAVAKSDAGARGMAPVLRHAGTDYAGSDRALSTSYELVQTIYEQAPDATAWSVAKVNALEAGCRVRP